MVINPLPKPVCRDAVVTRYYDVPWIFLPRSENYKLMETTIEITRYLQDNSLDGWDIAFGWNTPGMSHEFMGEATNKALDWAIRSSLFDESDYHNYADTNKAFDVTLERALRRNLDA